MVENVVVVGGGEHARVVLDAVLSRPDLYALQGFCDPQPCDATARLLGVARLAEDDLALAARSDVRLVLGVGTTRVSEVRSRIVSRLTEHGARFVAIVHARAVVSPFAVIGDGAFVAAGAVVNAGAKVGVHAIVNTAAVVEHDVDVGAFATLAPGAVVGGGTRIGEGSYLGLGCRVRDHVSIGARALVGMGAVVVGEVADESVVVGLPARPREELRR
jgi:acetyltransferase EpsM